MYRNKLGNGKEVGENIGLEEGDLYEAFRFLKNSSKTDEPSALGNA